LHKKFAALCVSSEASSVLSVPSLLKICRSAACVTSTRPKSEPFPLTAGRLRAAWGFGTVAAGGVPARSAGAGDAVRAGPGDNPFSAAINCSFGRTEAPRRLPAQSCHYDGVAQTFESHGKHLDDPLAVRQPFEYENTLLVGACDLFASP
jgi:hypothetical protein